MPYKPFEPKDTLEEALSKLWGAATEFVPTTRMEEIICMIANAQPTGIHAVPDIEAGDVGKVLTAGEDGAVWASGGGGGSGVVVLHMDPDTYALDKTWKEIRDLLAAGQMCVVGDSAELEVQYQFLVWAALPPQTDVSTTYDIMVFGFENCYSFKFSADTADDYPITDD